MRNRLAAPPILQPRGLDDAVFEMCGYSQTVSYPQPGKSVRAEMVADFTITFAGPRAAAWAIGRAKVRSPRGSNVKGGYVVAPPSLHVSGRRYELIERNIPPADAPDWLLALLRKPAETEASTSTLVTGVVVQGNRSDTLVSLAGTMHRRGMAPAAIEAALLEENQAKCSPPLPEDKVRAIFNEIINSLELVVL